MDDSPRKMVKYFEKRIKAMTAIIDYKAGNLTSVKLAFAALGVETVVTSDPKVIAAADRVVFPGVGAAMFGNAGMILFLILSGLLMALVAIVMNHPELTTGLV